MEETTGTECTVNTSQGELLWVLDEWCLLAPATSRYDPNLSEWVISVLRRKLSLVAPPQASWPAALFEQPHSSLVTFSRLEDYRKKSQEEGYTQR